MKETLLERILYLTGNGYDIHIMPYGEEDECIEIKLTKNNHTIARIIDPRSCRQSYAWESDEEWISYTILQLQMEYEYHMQRLSEIWGGHC